MDDDGALWQIGSLDLARYLAAVGVAAGPPTRGLLDALHEAHVRTFTFDNVDVLTGRHPGVDLAAIEEKFVGRGRGGYCFEHATLFAAAVQRLGFVVRRRLGRVGEPTHASRSHMTVEVVVDGDRLLADPGFGVSVLRPIPLRHGAEDDHGGWHYRMHRVAADPGRGWRLENLRTDGWTLMHTTDDLAVYPEDVVMGHHYTSTLPGGRFDSMLVVSAYRPDGSHHTLTAETLTVRRPGHPVDRRTLGLDEVLAHAAELGVHLDRDAADALRERVGGLRGRA